MINRGSLPKAPRGHCVRAVAVSTQRRLFRARHFRLVDSLKKIRRRAQNALSRRRPVSNRAAKIPVAQYGAMPMPKGAVRVLGPRWRAISYVLVVFRRLSDRQMEQAAFSYRLVNVWR